MIIPEQTRNNLEFDKLLKWLSSYAHSSLAKRIILKLEPFDSLENIQTRNKLISQCITLINEEGKYSFHGLANIIPILKKARIEGTYLSSAELYTVYRQCLLYSSIKQYIKQNKAIVPDLYALVEEIYEPSDFMRSIKATISEHGEIFDIASDKLLKIRKEIKEIAASVTTHLESFISDKNNAQLIQEPLVLDRDGRYVLLIKAEKRKEINGIIHGSSASGAAYYCELLSTVELNNKLKVIKEKEKDVCREILQKFTNSIRGIANELIINQRRSAKLDSLHCLATFAIEQGGCMAHFNNSSVLELEEVFHPLLKYKSSMIRKSAIVALSLKLEEPARGLIITGPNMGGKTVALKNIGLAVLMAHSGIPVIARRVSIPYLKALFADIGEKQDLMQNLSTFSSHVQNIIPMLNYSEEGALFIIDELGTGTDPSEGAPLAVAILEHLLFRRGLIITTTHHNAVKIYAESKEELINASMDFDISTLKPTFKIIPGIAGTSHAFDIATKLGVAETIVEKARSIRDKKDEAYLSVLEKLSEQMRDLEIKKEVWWKEKNQLEQKLRMSIEENSEQKKLLLEERRKLSERVKEFLRKSKSRWEEVVQEMKAALSEKAYSEGKQSIKEIEQEAETVLKVSIYQDEEPGQFGVND
ncbi:MAG: hypothetical protein A2Y62_17570, partial [Candidatus Fischerbacteria bacterium RBG_13_37_8]